MHESTLAKRYAIALAELAIEQNQLDAVGKELNDFLHLFQSLPALQFLMSSPTSESSEQHAVLATYMDKVKLASVTKNFLRLLIDKRRMALLEAIVVAYNHNMDQRAGRMAVKIEALMPLTSGQSSQLKEILSSITGKSVRLEETTDPGILGGMVITMGSIMVDYSIRNHLTRLKASMRG
ncbi:ATP synthase F1 subunit delta [Candidatus Magnetaquicoccus inordinatus]|uniref:ATP synthase F1 subunit delta n=1 Tax=Candidatus Magnetaquicoccus inordinatus TaxID=2496818 RepID=UPI00187D6402|nr:ATP synthase F1 subunit delta [Candidatus Magnetaquicoccus inordinatus]